nr:glycosyltransferase family 2 protein [Pseudomonas luteola]
MLSSFFHDSLKAEDKSASQTVLRLALQIPSYRDEALIWEGITALREGKPSEAFINFARVCEHLPKRADTKALLSHSIEQLGSPKLTEKFLQAALKTFPTDAILRKHYWNTCCITLDSFELISKIREQLADIENPAELRQVLELLVNNDATNSLIGVVRYDPKQKAITGWAIDLLNVDRVVTIRLQAGNATADFIANVTSPLLAQAGFPSSHGGIFIRLPQSAESVQAQFSGTEHELIGSPLAAIPYLAAPPPSIKDPTKQPVDILLPVYKGTEATLACIESLLRSSTHNRTPHQIIILDDLSPDIALVEAIQTLAKQGKLKHIRRPANLGFIRNMNRGMALHPERDVVWLNADTMVHGNWLDRLRDVAYQTDNIASVTPFSNNGELMSFPKSRVCHPMPTLEQHAELDRLASQLNSTPVEIEMGCGFCLFIKRRALEAVGYLDEVELQRGYGEESDWCLRARSKGWRHMGATHVFVAHAGGQSFGPEKALRVFQNNAILRRRYPDAERRFDTFLARDPLAPARRALQALLQPIGTASEYSVANASPPRLNTQLPTLPGHCWLIADRLDRVEIGERWLRLARQMARENHAVKLLLAHETPWETQLLTTGCVARLPKVEGLNEVEVLHLCGTNLALSLDTTVPPSASHPWYSLHLAHRYQLPLLAPEEADLGQHGAYELNVLRSYFSEPFLV